MEIPKVMRRTTFYCLYEWRRGRDFRLASEAEARCPDEALNVRLLTLVHMTKKVLYYII